jgi:hypothetical protein
MNLMMTLSLFSTLAIGKIPAYLIAKRQETDRYQDGTPIAILECRS